MIKDIYNSGGRHAVTLIKNSSTYEESEGLQLDWIYSFKHIVTADRNQSSGTGEMDKENTSDGRVITDERNISYVGGFIVGYSSSSGFLLTS